MMIKQINEYKALTTVVIVPCGLDVFILLIINIVIVILHSQYLWQQISSKNELLLPGSY